MLVSRCFVFVRFGVSAPSERRKREQHRRSGNPRTHLEALGERIDMRPSHRLQLRRRHAPQRAFDGRGLGRRADRGELAALRNAQHGRRHGDANAAAKDAGLRDDALCHG